MTDSTRPATRLARVLLIAAAAMLVTVAWRAPGLRREVDGSLISFAWLLTMSALALSLVAAALATRWRRAAGAFALALIGQAAALELIDAPAYNVNEHYFSWSVLLGSARGLLLLVPLVQSVVVLHAGRILWVRADPARHGISGVRLALAALVLAGLAANGSFAPGRFAGELLLGLWLALVNAGNVALVAAALPAGAIRGAGEAIDRAGRRLPLACAVWVTGVAALISWFVFDRTPIIPDSVSYLFQAKYFSTGRLYLPSPPELAAFDFEKLHSDGTRWWAYGFPGWPAVLAIGVRLRVPWLVNPVLAGVTVLVFYSLLSRLYDAAFARRVTLLLAASPWFLFMSGSQMAHTLAALLVLVAAWAVLVGARLAEEQRAGARAGAAGAGAGGGAGGGGGVGARAGVLWGAVGGLALGALFLTRPLEALLVAPAFGLVTLGFAGRRAGWAPAIAFVSAGAALASLSFGYNARLTGSAWTTPHTVWSSARWYPGADRMGFGADVGNLDWPHLDPLPGHGPFDVVINAHQNAYMVNSDLFGWSFGSLVLVVAFWFWGRRSRADRFFLVIVVGIVLGHSLYWFSGGPDIGARYWYQILLPLVVLTVRGAQELESRWTRGREGGGGTGRVGAFVAAATVVAVLTFLPWRALGKYHDYRGMNDHMARLAHNVDFGRAVVFVREGSNVDYPRALLANPPDFAGEGPIFARDLGPESRARILHHFADRTYWIVQGPAHPSAPFRVVEGPIDPR